MKIAFIGLGNMGGPMAANLLKAGHHVTGFDLAQPSRDALAKVGGTIAANVVGAVLDAEAVVTMLPAGPHVRHVYMGEGGVLGSAKQGALLIDSSTIDVESARAVSKAAAER